MVDGSLMSPICPKFQTRNLKHSRERLDAKGAAGSQIHAVLMCNSCSTAVWNRDTVAALNIRNVFNHMALNQNVRPFAFKRLEKAMMRFPVISRLWTLGYIKLVIKLIIYYD